MLKRLLLIAWLFGFVAPVQAHDPGLSRANIKLDDAGISVQMVFAQQDIDHLVVASTDEVRVDSADRFSTVRKRLQSILAAGVEVRDGEGQISPTSVGVVAALSDAVRLNLHYETNSSAIQIHIPLIARLSRGHRQYLTVQDSSANLRAQHILDAHSPPILLQTPGPGAFQVFLQYLKEGIWHIWIGFDHILFLLTLLLPAVLVYCKPCWQSRNDLRPAIADVFKVVTAFTVAHSFTLALAVLDVVSLPSRLVEASIACSVLVTAANNLRPVFAGSRWLLAFAFGLVHGFGFAGVLADLGLPGNAVFISLLGFNLGVEAGQLAIVTLVFPIAALLRRTAFYRTWLFGGGSAVAAVIAIVWMVERMFDFELLGF